MGYLSMYDEKTGGVRICRQTTKTQEDSNHLWKKNKLNLKVLWLKRK